MSSIRTAMDESSEIAPADRDRLLAELDTAYQAEPPPVLVLVGETGVGKSTTLNSLFNAGEPVGHARATTQSPSGVEVVAQEVKGSKGLLHVYDMPGLGDDIRTFDAHSAVYRDVLRRADAVLWVHPAEDRMVQFVQTAAAELFGQLHPELSGRLVFGLNKADQVHPNDWNPIANVPSDEQLRTLRAREEDFSARLRHAVPKWTGTAISYSALHRYNLAALFHALMLAVPSKRRWVLESRMDLADFTALVDRGLLSAARVRLGEPSDTPPPADDQPVGDDRREATPTHELLRMSPDEYERLVADPHRLVEWLRDRRGSD